MQTIDARLNVITIDFANELGQDDDDSEEDDEGDKENQQAATSLNGGKAKKAPVANGIQETNV